MKNFFKCFGLTVFVAVIGFSMVSCDLDYSEGAILKVVNNYAYPITRIVVSGGIDIENLSIITTQSFSINNDDFSYLRNVYIYAEGLTSVLSQTYFKKPLWQIFGNYIELVSILFVLT